jgi:deoxyguanosine kinase
MYLAIEGVIGVGKTSLARLLQPTFNAGLMLEVFEENPFLSDFYDDRARYALQTQLFFLLSRYRQQREAPQLLAEHNALIADYTFAKDALFARINLGGDELELYRRLHDALAEKIVRPDLLIYLHAPTDELMRRIARRGRPYERQMERDYIRQLGEAYDEFFATYTETPALIIDAAPLDYVANPADLQAIVERVHAALGLEYQTPLPLAHINHDDERA